MIARALILFYVAVILAAVVNSKANAADTNTVSSTVVTDKTLLLYTTAVSDAHLTFAAIGRW